MKLKLSREADHLDDPSIRAVSKAVATHIKRFVRNILGHVSERTFAQVTIRGEGMLADIVTGSLYRNGRCLTSPHLRIVEAPVVFEATPRRKGCTPAQIASGFANDRLRGIAA